MTEIRKRGWHPDPLGIHHERFYFADDRPGRLVRDDGRTEVYDEFPSAGRVVASIDTRSRGLGAWPELGSTPQPLDQARVRPAAITRPSSAPRSADESPVHDPWPDEPSFRWPRAAAGSDHRQSRPGAGVGHLAGHPASRIESGANPPGALEIDHHRGSSRD
jgi:hypothetical protein